MSLLCDTQLRCLNLIVHLLNRTEPSRDSYDSDVSVAVGVWLSFLCLLSIFVYCVYKLNAPRPLLVMEDE